MSDEASSSVGGHPLASPDPPPPIKTTAEDRNVVDRLSIAASSNSPPTQTPITPSTPSSTFRRNGSADPVARNALGKNPQIFPVNQGYVPYDSYTAPWAEARLSSLSEQLTNYPPPPWEDGPSRNPNPFAQSTYPVEYNSFGMSAANPPSSAAAAAADDDDDAAGGARANANSRPTGPGASRKPFVPSYRLFEDLVDASDFNGVLRAESGSGQGMAYSRK